MAGFKDRLDRLETSLSPRHAYYHGARERLEAKLAAVSEAHREHRERGGEPRLEGQSMASLLALVRSYPHGEVPLEVAEAARTKAEGFGHSPPNVAAKMVRLCLESRGCHTPTDVKDLPLSPTT
jgi:hypothetical protein